MIASKKLLRIPGDVLLSVEALASATERVMGELKMEPGHSLGPKRSELKRRKALSAEIFDFALEKLSRERN